MDLNVKHKAMKLPGKRRVGNLQDLELSKEF